MTAKEFSAQFAALAPAARAVTETYQNAQRFMDTVKEAILVDLGMPMTADVIHNLAHVQPPRFDKLGDILHEKGQKQEYPATAELTEPVEDLNHAFEISVGCLQDIDEALSTFIRTAESIRGCEAVARNAEGMQQTNSASFEKLLTAWTLWGEGKESAVSFDRWMKEYFSGQSQNAGGKIGFAAS